MNSYIYFYFDKLYFFGQDLQDGHVNYIPYKKMLNNSDFLRMNTKRTVKKILFKKQVCQLGIKSSQYACNQFFSGLLGWCIE